MKLELDQALLHSVQLQSRQTQLETEVAQLRHTLADSGVSNRAYQVQLETVNRQQEQQLTFLRSQVSELSKQLSGTSKRNDALCDDLLRVQNQAATEQAAVAAETLELNLSLEAVQSDLQETKLLFKATFRKRS